MRHLQISARSFYAVRASQRGPLPRQERSLHLLASELCGLAAAEVLGRVTVSRFASGLTAVTWSYWQLIRRPAAFLYGFHIVRGWMSILWLFLGRLCGDDDHPLLLLAALLWANGRRPLGGALRVQHGSCVSRWAAQRARRASGGAEHKSKISLVHNRLTGWAWQRLGHGWDGSARRYAAVHSVASVSDMGGNHTV